MPSSREGKTRFGQLDQPEHRRLVVETRTNRTSSPSARRRSSSSKPGACRGHRVRGSGGRGSIRWQAMTRSWAPLGRSTLAAANIQ